MLFMKQKIYLAWHRKNITNMDQNCEGCEAFEGFGVDFYAKILFSLQIVLN